MEEIGVAQEWFLGREGGREGEREGGRSCCNFFSPKSMDPIYFLFVGMWIIV